MTGSLTDLLGELAGTLEILTASEPSPGAGAARRAEVDELRERVSARMGLAPDILVVGIAGTTGAGKSTLFNRLAGAELSPVSARRPTTTEPVAAVFTSGAGPLLDWLEIPARHTITRPQFDLGPAVVVDVPDLDSTSTANRAVAETYIGAVDVIVWVVDPEKYADARLHEDFLRPLSTHAPIMEVVLNQVDRLSKQDAALAAADLQAKLTGTGISAPVHTLSARTGTGVAEIAANIRTRAEEKRAQSQRLAADARRLAAELTREIPAGGPPTPGSTAATTGLDAFENDVAASAGVREYAAAQARGYRHELVRASAWPPLRVLHRTRKAPPRAELTITYLAEPVARLSSRFTGPGPWERTLHATALTAGATMRRRLENFSPTPHSPRLPTWARAVSGAHWLGVVILAAAVIAFGAEIGVRYFGITIPPALPPVAAEPGYPALPPVPWSVAIGVLGLVVALLASGAGAVGRALSVRSYRRVREREVAREVRAVVVETVSEPLQVLLGARRRYGQLLNQIGAWRVPGRAKVHRAANRP